MLTLTQEDPAHPEAIALYEKAGYHRIGPYGIYADDPLTVCFGKALPGTQDPPK